MNSKHFKWPSIFSFVLVWVAISLLIWAIACILALSFSYSILDAGLIPVEILLALWLIPVALTTLTVQMVLYLIGRSKWPETPESNKWLVLFGTPLLTGLFITLITYFSGGPDAFIPRL